MVARLDERHRRVVRELQLVGRVVEGLDVDRDVAMRHGVERLSWPTEEDPDPFFFPCADKRQ